MKQEQAGLLQGSVIEGPSKRHLCQGCCAGAPEHHLYPHFGFLGNRLTERIDLHKGSGG